MAVTLFISCFFFFWGAFCFSYPTCTRQRNKGLGYHVRLTYTFNGPIFQGQPREGPHYSPSPRSPATCTWGCVTLNRPFDLGTLLGYPGLTSHGTNLNCLSLNHALTFSEYTFTNTLFKLFFSHVIKHFFYITHKFLWPVTISRVRSFLFWMSLDKLEC